jgi:hypothetical protein
MKAYGGVELQLRAFLTSKTIGTWLVCLMPHPFYSQENNLRCPLDRSLGGIESWSKVNKFSPRQEWNPNCRSMRISQIVHYGATISFLSTLRPGVLTPWTRDFDSGFCRQSLKYRQETPKREKFNCFIRFFSLRMCLNTWLSLLLCNSVSFKRI